MSKSQTTRVTKLEARLMPRQSGRVRLTRQQNDGTVISEEMALTPPPDGPFLESRLVAALRQLEEGIVPPREVWRSEPSGRTSA